MITRRFFDNYNGVDVEVYTLTDGISVDICTLGATVLALRVPDKNGKMVDVALGMTNAKDMVSKVGDYMGAVVGRCGNRIAEGKFALDGVTYRLDTNNGLAHLHGGYGGFNTKVFTATVANDALQLRLTSEDGDQGYPGKLDLCVTYIVKGTKLVIDYSATCTKPTLCNPTNHTYFNLEGQGSPTIYNNYLQIFADSFLAVDGDLIPTEVTPVYGTPMDFTKSKPIGKDICAHHKQLKLAGGYDHNFCLTGNRVAQAYSPITGIVMDVFTNLPGVQFYSGNFLANNVGKSVYPRRSGFCLETQFYPNAINRTDCDQPVLRPGQVFTSQTTYQFSVKK